MKKFLVLLMVAAFALALSAHGASAQAANGTLTGKAVRWSGEPISGATIAVLAGPLETDKEYDHTTTAADGSYTINAPAGQTVWLHIRTFGTWWGYSYYIPFNLTAGETISQVYFALGPRDVATPINLPAPVSNVAPQTGTTAPPPAAPAPPVSNVKPLTGSNDNSVTVPAPVAKPVAKPATKPTSDVKPLTGGNYLPQTGGTTDNGLWLVLGLAAIAGIAGLGLRRTALTRR
jgi:LPXTG-motif cell wall-anchored protein